MDTRRYALVSPRKDRRGLEPFPVHLLDALVDPDALERHSHKVTIEADDEFGSVRITLWRAALDPVLLQDSDAPPSNPRNSYARAHRSREVHRLADHVDRLSSVLVLLCHGGYFSAAMFVGGRCVAHKSLHRFISQSPKGGARRGSSKNKGGRKAIRGSKGAAGGSGSYLAMYNEGKHLREVRTLLATEVWAEHVATASVILVHAPGPVNTKILFGRKGGPVDRTDARVRSVPFSSKRPSYEEAVQVFKKFSTAAVTRLDGGAPGGSRRGDASDGDEVGHGGAARSFLLEESRSPAPPTLRNQSFELLSDDCDSSDESVDSESADSVVPFIYLFVLRPTVPDERRSPVKLRSMAYIVDT